MTVGKYKECQLAIADCKEAIASGSWLNKRTVAYISFCDQSDKSSIHRICFQRTFYDENAEENFTVHLVDTREEYKLTQINFHVLKRDEEYFKYARRILFHSENLREIYKRYLIEILEIESERLLIGLHTKTDLIKKVVKL